MTQDGHTGKRPGKPGPPPGPARGALLELLADGVTRRVRDVYQRLLESGRGPGSRGSFDQTLYLLVRQGVLERPQRGWIRKVPGVAFGVCGNLPGPSAEGSSPRPVATRGRPPPLPPAPSRPRVHDPDRHPRILQRHVKPGKVPHRILDLLEDGKPRTLREVTEELARREFASLSAVRGAAVSLKHKGLVIREGRRIRKAGPEGAGAAAQPQRRISIIAEPDEDLRPVAAVAAHQTAPRDDGEPACPTCRGSGRKRNLRGDLLADPCWRCRGDPKVGACAAKQDALPRHPAPAPGTGWRPCVVCETRQAWIDHSSGERIPCGGCRAVGWIHESKVPR